jgi:hypothetical protein
MESFLQAENDAFFKMPDAFTKATGVRVTATREQGEEIKPKAVLGREMAHTSTTVVGLSQPEPPGTYGADGLLSRRELDSRPPKDADVRNTRNSERPR